MPGELAKAVCQVMGAVRSVPETGWNGHGKYAYASDADLLGRLQPAMADAGLALVPRSVQTATVQHGESKAGNAKWRTDLVVTYDLLHISGESTEVEAPGCGIDGEDKGVYKAMTGALKYALRHLFLVPTGEDAERTARDQDRREEQRPREQDRRDEQRPPKVTPWDQDEWTRSLAPAGLTLDDALWWCLAKTDRGVHPKDMPDEERARALKFFTSDQGGERVRGALHDVRSELQRAFFKLWTVEFPEPRKKDGVSDEDRERANASSEENRKLVMREWYGVESAKQVPIRAALKGIRGIPWLRDVGPKEFSDAVDEALGAAVTEARDQAKLGGGHPDPHAGADNGQGGDDPRQWGG